MKRTFYYVILIILIASTAYGQNLVTNGDFSASGGSVDGWTCYYIEGGGGVQGGAVQYQTSVLGLTDPVDGHAAGNQTGANQSGQHTGLYQEISGLTPGVTYRLSMEGQILSVPMGPGDPLDGDDTISLFWEDGTTADFATSWPGSAVVLDSTLSTQDSWHAMSGDLVPSGTTILVGGSSHFTDPEWDYGFCNHLMDNFSLELLSGPPTPEPPTGVKPWTLYR